MPKQLIFLSSILLTACGPASAATGKHKTHPEFKDGSCLVLEFLLINLMVE
jgi:hypothetical protein